MKSSKPIASGSANPAKRPAWVATNSPVGTPAASAARTFFNE